MNNIYRVLIKFIGIYYFIEVLFMITNVVKYLLSDAFNLVQFSSNISYILTESIVFYLIIWRTDSILKILKIEDKPVKFEQITIRAIFHAESILFSIFSLIMTFLNSYTLNSIIVEMIVNHNIPINAHFYFYCVTILIPVILIIFSKRIAAFIVKTDYKLTSS